MKTIISFEDLKSLPNGQKVYHIHSGNIDSFIVVGHIQHNSTGLIVHYSDKNIKFLYPRDFGNGVFTLDYNKVEWGQLMIQQIQKAADNEINNIRAVYLKDI